MSEKVNRRSILKFLGVSGAVAGVSAVPVLGDKIKEKEVKKDYFSEWFENIRKALADDNRKACSVQNYAGYIVVTFFYENTSKKKVRYRLDLSDVPNEFVPLFNTLNSTERSKNVNRIDQKFLLGVSKGEIKDLNDLRKFQEQCTQG